MSEAIDHENESDRLRVDQGFLCDTCGHRWYYTKPRCPECSGREILTYDLERGKIIAQTEVRATPDDVRTPNKLGLVQFDSGVQVIAQLNRTDIKTGDMVQFDGDHELRAGSELSVSGPRLYSIQ